MAANDTMTAYQRVQAARNSKRPMGMFYIDHMIDDFIELHGDRRFGDDAAIVSGIGFLNGIPVTVIAMERGDTIEDRMKRHFGCPEPEGYRKALRMMQEAETACASLNMEIIGGHTEITEVVRQPLVVVTGVGKIRRDVFLSPKNIHPDQDIIVTKWIGLEATTILAKEREAVLKKRFSADFMNTAREFDQYLSVVPDARIAMQTGVVCMHDITEGGVFGALWEVGEAGEVGIDADLRKIPIRQETVEICEFFDVNPYQIMSSGSMLMITDNGQKLVDALEQGGIHAAVIGRTTGGNDRILHNGEEIRYLDRPQADELYRAMERKFS